MISSIPINTSTIQTVPALYAFLKHLSKTGSVLSTLFWLYSYLLENLYYNKTYQYVYIALNSHTQYLQKP